MLLRSFLRSVSRHEGIVTLKQSTLPQYCGTRLDRHVRRATTSAEAAPNANRTRNIGIIAHIDAGKTTTTERMLYYSGYTRRIGDVDDGSTVTDFLPAERARGITIQSAAITFEWPPTAAENVAITSKDIRQHHINLIDTPGHADFTFEVRRSLRILDGAVCILDGVAGVEAQTEQVWKQAAEWQIPRLAYVNKLDRDGAAFERTVRELGSRLGGWPAVCGIPWWEDGKGKITGIGDVIHLRGLLYNYGGDGKEIKSFDLEALEQKDARIAGELRKARTALIELLSEHDDQMVEDFFEAEEDHLKVPPESVVASLRRCLLKNDGKLIPVFAGASFRNIGVQPLLDSVTLLLPNPLERPDPEVSLGPVKGSLQDFLSGKLSTAVPETSPPRKKGPPPAAVTPSKILQGCALAFKVVHDPKRGALVYFRVYHGSIARNAQLYNTNLLVSERSPTLLRMYANDSVAVPSIQAGQIGVIAGLKFARTGDTLISYVGNKATPPEPLNLLQLRPIVVPPPVFFASIEPNSLKEEKDVHEKLQFLLREDPSLQVSQDEDTGQTQLAGMGELHLEIARDRLINDLKAKASMGEIEIGFRETILADSDEKTFIYDKEKQGGGSGKGKAGVTAAAKLLPEEPQKLLVNTDKKSNHFAREHDGNFITIVAPALDHKGKPLEPETPALPAELPLAEIQSALFNGSLGALSRGPAHNYPVRNIHLTLMLDPAQHIFHSETTTSALSSAARFATRLALKDAIAKAGSAVMEPVMDVTITVDEASLGNVVQDLSSSRGGQVLSLDDDADSDTETEDKIDISKIYAPPDPFGPSESSRGNEGSSRMRHVKAKVPLKEMVGYLKHLRSITAGRGTFVMSVDRFVKMNAQRERMLLREIRGGE